MRRSEDVFPLVFRFVLILVCCGFLYPRLPVNYLEIAGKGGVLFAAPLSSGSPFITEYIHSVQLTPVVDEYRIVQGKIWIWEERVQSHNAGLPFAPPDNGRFIVDAPWMIVQGGRRFERRMVYRVGTEELGRNIWRLPPFEDIEAYEKFPSKRVFFETSIKKLSEAPLIGWQSKDSSR